MLIVSAIGSVLAWANAQPSKLEAYGVEFPQLDPRALYIVALVGSVYLLTTFAIHATLDLVKWQRGYWVAPDDGAGAPTNLVAFATAMIVVDIMLPLSVSVGATFFLVHYLP